MFFLIIVYIILTPKKKIDQLKNRTVTFLPPNLSVSLRFVKLFHNLIFYSYIIHPWNIQIPFLCPIINRPFLLLDSYLRNLLTIYIYIYNLTFNCSKLQRPKLILEKTRATRSEKPKITIETRSSPLPFKKEKELADELFPTLKILPVPVLLSISKRDWWENFPLLPDNKSNFPRNNLEIGRKVSRWKLCAHLYNNPYRAQSRFWKRWLFVTTFGLIAPDANVQHFPGFSCWNFCIFATLPPSFLAI